KAITFGSDANGKPIRWKLASSGGSSPAAAKEGIIRVDEKGYLHVTFEQNATEIDLMASDEDAFGSYANKTPWIEFSWVDRTFDARLPNIDVFVEDTRPGKLNN